MIYADLHIHIGQSLNKKAVKITASPKLTLPEVIRVSSQVKGLDMIGVIDSHSIGVREDYRELLRKGIIHPLEGGGYAAGSLAIVPGMEIELKVAEGHAHFLAFFPSIEHLEGCLLHVQPFVHNWQLSSQKAYIDPNEWIEMVEKAEGIWLPAHAFTPHKGIYGACCQRLKGILSQHPQAIEMGLSADRVMAHGIRELDDVVLLSNSDAHSLPNIAREYNEIFKSEKSFAGLADLLKKGDRNLIRNYGLPPKMGKYHRSYCLQCAKIMQGDPPVLQCPDCKSQQMVMGVLDRLYQIADREIDLYQDDEYYVYRVPLAWLPGIGPKKIAQLLTKFGTEMNVYHQATFEDLKTVIGEKLALVVVKAQKGQLEFSSGGGGIFGKVTDIIT